MGSKLDYSSLPDDQLLLYLRRGDAAAYTEIYNRYYHVLFIHALKKLRDESEAKDIIQEVFTTLWNKKDAILKSSDNIGGYLYTSVRNKILDFFSHQQVSSRYITSLADFVNNNSVNNTDHLIREKQLLDYVEREILNLPPKMRVIFQMSRIGQLSHKEIADRLETTENNVSKQINNALRILRAKFHVLIILYTFLN